MELNELVKEIKKLKYKDNQLPSQYSHYKEGKVPPLPYLLYYVDGREDLIADNTNYIQRQTIELELYTKNTEFGLLKEIEEMLNKKMIVASIIPFTYISDQDFYLTRLSFKI